MRNLSDSDLEAYIQDNIVTFHQNRVDSLRKLKLKTILKKKNPYLYKAKHLESSAEIIKSIADAFLSSQEETVFGNWLEQLAIFVCCAEYGGIKSGIKGIDLEFEKEGDRYIVNIKSGPNWGNSSQIEKMIKDFESAKKTLRTSGAKISIIAVNGCCYGKENNPDKGAYYKYCGQKFWNLISGDDQLYAKFIHHLGHSAKEKNVEFDLMYEYVLKSFTDEFESAFCTSSGSVDWLKLLDFNSAE